MILIYQILGTTNYNVYKYYFNDSLLGEFKLSSFALGNYFKKEGKEVKFIFILPHSLFLNKISSLDKTFFMSYDYLKDDLYINIEKFNEDIKTLELDMKKDISILVVPSIGRYTQNDSVPYKVLNFCGFIEDIQYFIFDDMIRKFIENEENIEKIILDISTGQNVYIHPAIEALRRTNVFIKLRRLLLQRDEHIPSTKISFSDPAIKVRSTDTKIKINLENISVKTFFEIPIQEKEDFKMCRWFKRILPKEEENHLKKELGMNPTQKEHLNKIVDFLIFSYNAIKYNTPLYFFHISDIHGESYPTCKEIDDLVFTISDIVRRYLMRHEITKSSNSITITYSSLDNKKICLNVYLALSLVYSVSSFYNKKIIGKYPCLEEIQEIFSELYDKLDLPLNRRFLRRDIRDLTERKYNFIRREDLTKKERSEENMDKKGDQKRNFFAHSGFSENEIEFSGSYVYWKREFISRIKKWLMEPGLN